MAEDIRRIQLPLAEAGLSICNRNQIVTGLQFHGGVDAAMLSAITRALITEESR